MNTHTKYVSKKRKLIKTSSYADIMFQIINLNDINQDKYLSILGSFHSNVKVTETCCWGPSVALNNSYFINFVQIMETIYLAIVGHIII